MYKCYSLSDVKFLKLQNQKTQMLWTDWPRNILLARYIHYYIITHHLAGRAPPGIAKTWPSIKKNAGKIDEEKKTPLKTFHLFNSVQAVQRDLTESNEERTMRETQMANKKLILRLCLWCCFTAIGIENAGVVDCAEPTHLKRTQRQTSAHCVCYPSRRRILEFTTKL